MREGMADRRDCHAITKATGHSWPSQHFQSANDGRAGQREFLVSAITAAFRRLADHHNGLHKLADATLRNSKQNRFFFLAYNSFVVPIVAGLLHLGHPQCIADTADCAVAVNDRGSAAESARDASGIALENMQTGM